MPRLLAIAALLMQLLMAQGAMADATCVHTHAAQPAGASTAAHHSTHHDRSAPDNDQSLWDCECGCGVTGHCASSAVVSVLRTAEIDLSIRSDAPTAATAAITSGYRDLPYRPPSATA